MSDEELAQLAREIRHHETEANERRPRLNRYIYEYKQRHGDRRGWQTDLVALTGLTRERIRQIINAEEKRRADEHGTSA